MILEGRFSKISSIEDLVCQCFRNLWADQLTQEVLNKLRPLKNTNDYSLVQQDLFDSGLEDAEWDTKEYFNEILDQKAISCIKKIKFPFNVNEIMKRKAEPTSAISRLFRKLLPQKNKKDL